MSDNHCAQWPPHEMREVFTGDQPFSTNSKGTHSGLDQLGSLSRRTRAIADRHHIKL
jgi:hypothetical protein